MIVRGLPTGRYIASYTTAQENARELPPIVSDGTIAVSLPAAGIMTIRQETPAGTGTGVADPK
jgi:hypothetical protein